MRDVGKFRYVAVCGSALHLFYSVLQCAAACCIIADDLFKGACEALRMCFF